MNRVENDLKRIVETAVIDDVDGKDCWRDLIEAAKRLQGV